MNDALIDLASAVSSLCGHIGFAFVEDDQVPALAEALDDFFTRERIPVDEGHLSEYYVALREGPSHAASKAAD